MLGAVVIKGPKRMECRIAKAMTKAGGKAVAGFGCSDCRCRSHLFRLSGSPVV